MLCIYGLEGGRVHHGEVIHRHTGGGCELGFGFFERGAILQREERLG